VTFVRLAALTIWRPLLSYGHSYKASCARPGFDITCNFLTSGHSAGARELSENCVSQNSGSLETKQPCVLAQGGGSGSPPRNFCNLWANLHSEPFPGQNDLQNYKQSWTCVWAKFSLYTCMMYGVVLTNHNILMFTWLSSLWKQPTQRVMS